MSSLAKAKVKEEGDKILLTPLLVGLVTLKSSKEKRNPLPLIVVLIAI